MRVLSFMAVIALLWAGVSCSKTDKIGPDEPDDPQEQNPYKPLSLTQSQKEIVKAGNSFALEFGSIHYNEDDYVRDYEVFLKLKKDGAI